MQWISTRWRRWQRKRRESQCRHFMDARYIDAGDVVGCEECLKIGAEWVHLRRCMICGKVGCCDQSPNKHASAHFHETDHAIVRSVEPGESWGWCYVHRVFMRDVDVLVR